MAGIIHKEPHFDLTIDENNVNEGATKIVQKIRPHWPVDKYQFKLFTNGLSNKLVGVWYEGHYNEMVLVRVYGHGSELFINHTTEIRNIRLMHQAKFTHSLYATFTNGLAYEFLPGDILTVDSVRSLPIYKLVSKRLAQMHKLEPVHDEINSEPFIWDKTEKFMAIMPRSFFDPDKQAKFERIIRPYQELEEEYNLLKSELSRLDSPVVFAHNDLLLANILYDEKENTVTFIDFEYGANNYQAFDIANHFAEFAGLDSMDYSLYPDEKLQRSWLRLYLEEYNNCSSVTEDEISRLYMQVNEFVHLTHFFWGCWALLQSEHSDIDFDYLGYAAIRFDECFKGRSKSSNSPK